MPTGLTDRRTLEQLCADYLTGTAITGWPSPDTDPGLAQHPPSPPGHAIIVIPFDTALGLPHPPRHPTPHAPAGDSSVDGRVDGTCRGPGCTVPAHAPGCRDAAYCGSGVPA